MQDGKEMKNSAMEKTESIADKKKRTERNRAERETAALNAAEKRKIKREERKIVREARARARFAKRQAREIKRASAERKREEKRAKIEKAREDKRRERGNNGGWIAAVVSLGCSVLVLGSLLTLSAFTDKLGAGKTNAAANTSQRAFYDFVGYVDNMETDMSKLFVSSDREARQKILGEITVCSNLADASLAQLPITDESKYYTSKYINQVGDYTKYLNNRLIDGYNITDSEYEDLKKLYEANRKLKKILSDLASGIDENYDFDMLTDNNPNDLIISGFNGLEENATDYPEMIYDGPFSDGLEAQRPKGITGEEINELDAKEKFIAIFKEYGLEKTEVVGMTENSRIECYNVTADTDRGAIFAQFSKIGGHLVSFSSFKECENINLGEEECVAIAGRFLESVGLKNMKCVWATEDENTVRLDFVYTIGDVYVYPDMVKINVCRENGRVIGMDADAYYINHTVRKIVNPKHTMAEAREKAERNIDVYSASMAITPKGKGREIFAYEFIGVKDGATYYVYIDADTLKESDIFRLVETEQGEMLL